MGQCRPRSVLPGRDDHEEDAAVLGLAEGGAVPENVLARIRFDLVRIKAERFCEPEAFGLAQKYMNPVLVLCDGFTGAMMEPVVMTESSVRLFELCSEICFFPLISKSSWGRLSQ